jgi:hypothetical protein
MKKKTDRCSSQVRMRVVLSLVMIGCFIAITHAAPKKFFECSNPISPAVSDRSDKIRSCCDGELQQMLAMENIRKALRAVTVNRSAELSGPADVSGKMECYVSSIEYITGVVKTFPPDKNQDKSDQYYAMLDNLNTYVGQMQQNVSVLSEQSGSKDKLTTEYSRFVGTCRSCHANFR